MTARILVTVSRSWTDWVMMTAVLKKVHDTHPHATLVHGDANHGDRDAARIWKSFGGRQERWPAAWSNCAPECRHPVRRNSRGIYCPYAGMRRNLAMVASAPDMCLAFIRGNSRGASHCAKAAEDAGIPTSRHEAAVSTT